MRSFASLIVLLGLIAPASADDANWRLHLVVGDQITYSAYFRNEKDTIVKTVKEVRPNGETVLEVVSTGGRKAIEVYTAFASRVSGAHQKYWWGNDSLEFYARVATPSHNGTAMPGMPEGGWEHWYDVNNEWGSHQRKRLVTCSGVSTREMQLAGVTFTVKVTECIDRIHDKQTGQNVTGYYDTKTGFLLKEDRTWSGDGKTGFELIGMKLASRPEKVTRN